MTSDRPRRSRRFAKAALTLLLCLSACLLSGCKVQVFDLQPITAGTPTATLPSGTATPHIARTNEPLPMITNTPPIHIAPTRISESTAIEILELVMINGGSGWGVAQIPRGAGQMIVKTTNGGDNWKNATPSEVIYENSGRNSQTSAYFLDSNQAWAVFWEPDNWNPDAGVTVWKTIDSGASWKKIALPTEGYTLQYFKDVRIGFVDSQIGWIFAKLGRNQDREYIGLYTTHDGGESWSMLVSSDSSNLPSKGGKNGATFRSASEGWISGSNAKDEPGSFLWRTTDGGNSWEKQMLQPLADEDIPQDLFSSQDITCTLSPPKFVDFQYQYAWMQMACQGGSLTEPLGLLYWTYDSGNSWRSFRLPVANGSLVFYGIYQGWYSRAMEAGSAYAYEIQATTNGGADWNPITQTAWNSDLQFITAAIGWGVVNYEGRYAMVKTGDGGYSWSQIYPMLDP